MDKRVLIVIGLLITILIGMGGYLYWLLKQEDAPKAVMKPQEVQTPTITTLEQGKDEESLDKIGPLYDLDQFTLNLRSDNGGVYLIIKISLELSMAELKNELDAKNAVIRDVIIRILESKSYETLLSDKGKEEAMDEIINILNSMLEDGYIKNAYITKFIVS